MRQISRWSRRKFSIARNPSQTHRSGFTQEQDREWRNESNPVQSGSDTAKDAGGSPTIPSVYSELLEALESPDVTNEQWEKSTPAT